MTNTSVNKINLPWVINSKWVIEIWNYYYIPRLNSSNCEYFAACCYGKNCTNTHEHHLTSTETHQYHQTSPCSPKMTYYLHDWVINISHRDKPLLPLGKAYSSVGFGTHIKWMGRQPEHCCTISLSRWVSFTIFVGHWATTSRWEPQATHNACQSGRGALRAQVWAPWWQRRPPTGAWPATPAVESSNNQ